jgi:hypothetical protein
MTFIPDKCLESVTPLALFSFQRRVKNAERVVIGRVAIVLQSPWRTVTKYGVFDEIEAPSSSLASPTASLTSRWYERSCHSHHTLQRIMTSIVSGVVTAQ